MRIFLILDKNEDISYLGINEDVAQLVRVLACHAKGRGFDSRRPRKRYFIKKYQIESIRHDRMDMTCINMF